mgnify:CR=1 FL=1
MRVVRRALELVLGRVLGLVREVVRVIALVDAPGLAFLLVHQPVRPGAEIIVHMDVLAHVPELVPELTQRRFNNAD